MKVAFHANVIDEDARAIADALDPVLKKLARSLDGAYGGPMEHLWIQIEMLAYLAWPDGRARHPFRFQERVSGIHAASAVLLEKQKQLGGFDAGLFRERILANCSSLGYPLSPEAH